MTTPTIIAHRGASGLAPENTLAAFRKAIALDADGIEFDLHLTADGAVVVHHDFRMSRYWARQNGEWLADVGPALRDMTLDELRAYDIGRLAPGSDYAARYPDYSPEDGAVAPTFDEVLDLVNASAPPDFQLWVELKLAPADQEPTSDPNALAEDAVVALEASGLAARATGVRTGYLSAERPWMNNLQADQPDPSPWTAPFDVRDFEGSAACMIKAAGAAPGPQPCNISLKKGSLPCHLRSLACTRRGR